MVIRIYLTTLGSNAGPLLRLTALPSVTVFETGIAKDLLLYPGRLYTVPDGTTDILIENIEITGYDGVCEDTILHVLTLDATTTTTTTGGVTPPTTSTTTTSSTSSTTTTATTSGTVPPTSTTTSSTSTSTSTSSTKSTTTTSTSSSTTTTSTTTEVGTLAEIYVQNQSSSLTIGGDLAGVRVNEIPGYGDPITVSGSPWPLGEYDEVTGTTDKLGVGMWVYVNVNGTSTPACVHIQDSAGYHQWQEFGGISADFTFSGVTINSSVRVEIWVTDQVCPTTTTSSTSTSTSTSSTTSTTTTLEMVEVVIDNQSEGVTVGVDEMGVRIGGAGQDWITLDGSYEWPLLPTDTYTGWSYIIGTDTVEVTLTGESYPNRIEVTDSNGDKQCKDYIGDGTYTFTGVVRDSSTAILIELSHLSCPTTTTTTTVP